MSIIAMQVSQIDRHPDADALRVVSLSTPAVARLVVVANMEEPFEVGDVVAVARVGAVLDDGTTIRKARLRGIDSFGMILGRVQDPVGADLASRYGKPAEEAEAEDPQIPAGTHVVKWTSIEGLPHVRRTIVAQARLDSEQIVLPRVTYRAKVKLDGTNAAVHVLPRGQFVAQSRTRLLTPQSDNYGFAAWVHESPQYFGTLHERLGPAIVYGEWCGPGIQKRVAVSQIDKKIFAVFAIVLGDPAKDTARIVFEPETIAAMLPEHPDVRVLPWHGEPVVLDFHDESGLQKGAEEINEMVAVVEAVDPWVRDQFGVEGVGEGVVLYPVDPVSLDERGGADRDLYAPLMFKAKGEKHRVNRQPKAVQVDPQLAGSLAAFVEQFVTPARLEQGATEACEGQFEMRRMGDFLKWLGRDVFKESELEREALGVEWKKLAKAVAHAGQRWYRRKVAEG